MSCEKCGAQTPGSAAYCQTCFDAMVAAAEAKDTRRIEVVEEEIVERTVRNRKLRVRVRVRRHFEGVPFSAYAETPDPQDGTWRFLREARVNSAEEARRVIQTWLA